MYVIAIAWLYVTVLMAATEPNLTAGVLTFVCYGLLPLSLLLWLFGAPRRKSHRDSLRHSSQTRVAMRPVTPSRR